MNGGRWAVAATAVVMVLTACGGGGDEAEVGGDTVVRAQPDSAETTARSVTIEAPAAASTTSAPSSTTSTVATPVSTPAPTPSPDDVLQANWLYGVGPLTSAGCAAGSQVELGTVEGLRSFYESVVACLNTAWLQVDPELTPALLVVFSGPAPADSCAAGVEYSFYCWGNGTIYMYADEINAPWNDYAGDDFSHEITRLAATWVVAHEYGHHLQNVAGIASAIGSNWQGTETERRLELQASCLADVFMASQADAYPVADEYWDWQENWRGTRLPNHGSPESHQLWVDRGRYSADPAACNTFAAPSAEVT